MTRLLLLWRIATNDGFSLYVNEKRSVKLISRVSLGPCSSGTRGGGTRSRKLSGRSAVGGGFGTSLWGRAATLPNWATIRRLPKRPAPGASRPWATSSASGGSTCDPCLRRSRNPRNRTPPRPVTFWAGCHRPSPNRRPHPTCKSATRLVVTSSPSAPMGAFPIWTLRSRFWREPSRLINPGSRPLIYMGRRHLRSLKFKPKKHTKGAGLLRVPN